MVFPRTLTCVLFGLSTYHASCFTKVRGVAGPTVQKASWKSKTTTPSKLGATVGTYLISFLSYCLSPRLAAIDNKQHVISQDNQNVLSSLIIPADSYIVLLLRVVTVHNGWPLLSHTAPHRTPVAGTLSLWTGTTHWVLERSRATPSDTMMASPRGWWLLWSMDICCPCLPLPTAWGGGHRWYQPQQGPRPATIRWWWTCMGALDDTLLWVGLCTY